ncbi:unnamed protein product, partial [Tilletia controversa]
DLIKIRSLPQTEEDKARDRNAELLRGNSCINVHPILSRIGWDLDGHDDDDDDDDDYDDDYDDDLDDDFDDEYDDDDEDGVEADDEYDDDNTRGEVYIVNSGLEKKEFPHQLLDECATCPPVYTLQVELDLSNYYHYYEEPNPELDPTSNSDYYNYVGEPVLVRHVIGCLIENSRNLCHRRPQFIVDNQFVADKANNTDFDYLFPSYDDFKTGCPSVTIREDGVLHLAFEPPYE